MRPAAAQPSSPPRAPAHPGPAHATMQCMEIRGGNEPVDTAFSMPGLEAWVYSRPFRDANDDGLYDGGYTHTFLH